MGKTITAKTDETFVNKEFTLKEIEVKQARNKIRQMKMIDENSEFDAISKFKRNQEREELEKELSTIEYIEYLKRALNTAEELLVMERATTAITESEKEIAHNAVIRSKQHMKQHKILLDLREKEIIQLTNENENLLSQTASPLARKHMNNLVEEFKKNNALAKEKKKRVKTEKTIEEIKAKERLDDMMGSLEI